MNKVETMDKDRKKVREQSLQRETMLTPTLEHRLNHVLGAAQALWHVSKEVEEEMDQQALMFIHEALVEHVKAIEAGLYKYEQVGSIFDTPCPTLYHD